jgi:hypothetical protein
MSKYVKELSDLERTIDNLKSRREKLFEGSLQESFGEIGYKMGNSSMKRMELSEIDHSILKLEQEKKKIEHCIHHRYKGHYEYTVELQGTLERDIYYKERDFVDSAKSGRLSECELFLKEGGNINANNDHGTALTRAAYNGQLEICEFLLKNGANVNIADIIYGGWTALMMAAENGNIRMCKLLIEYGADQNFVTYEGKTLTTCCKKIFRTEVVSLLKEQEIIKLEKLDSEIDVQINGEDSGNNDGWCTIL